MGAGQRSPSRQKSGKVQVLKNGPYLVSGSIPLSEQTIVRDAAGCPFAWQQGKVYPVTEVYSLCRCGRSKTMPFCNGAHVQAGFDGTETSSRNRYMDTVETIEGPAITLTDNRPLCVHAGFCDREGGIWNLTRLSDDPERMRTAIEEAANCPSGRLVVWDKEGRPIEPDFEQSIVLVEEPGEALSGPIWLRGCIPVESADGELYELRNRVTLCRCGRSRNKPFCDGSHKAPQKQG